MKKIKFLIALMASSMTLLCNSRADDMATNSIAVTTTTETAAPAMSPDATPWQLAVTIPIFAAGINGNATLRGRQQDVNVSFNTLREHLDASFALGLDLSKGKFDLYSDASYMKFSGNFGGPLGGKTDVDLKFVLADAGVGYVLVKAGEEHPFILAGTVGVRYWYADTGLTFRGSGGNVTLSGGNTYDVVDPVIGLRGSQYFTRKFHLDFSADGGGFNINNDTDWTWSATGMFTYDFVKWFSLSAGYKAVALDESNGSGTGEKGLNLIFNGALVAVTLKF
ncbi:MAG TPA: hypothetical protein VHY30_09100 [Verrucomicrobiae bacterium]|jgi:hypothetical protein|nr:hypothetical protein [Verrucomicrobiae bacterium]